MSTRTKGPSSEHEEALRRQLRTWVKHGLISGTEADAVMAYETHPERTRPPSRTGPIRRPLPTSAPPWPSPRPASSSGGSGTTFRSRRGSRSLGRSG
jgi:hypothetical protein